MQNAPSRLVPPRGIAAICRNCFTYRRFASKSQFAPIMYSERVHLIMSGKARIHARAACAPFGKTHVALLAKLEIHTRARVVAQQHINPVFGVRRLLAAAGAGASRGNPGNVDNEIGARHGRIYCNRYVGCSAISSAISTSFFHQCARDDRSVEPVCECPLHIHLSPSSSSRTYVPPSAEALFHRGSRV